MYPRPRPSPVVYWVCISTSKYEYVYACTLYNATYVSCRRNTSSHMLITPVVVDSNMIIHFYYANGLRHIGQQPCKRLYAYLRSLFIFYSYSYSVPIYEYIRQRVRVRVVLPVPITTTALTVNKIRAHTQIEATLIMDAVLAS